MVNYYPLINKNEIILKKIGSESVVFVRSLQEKKITLNESAKFIFDKCDGKNNIIEIIELFSKKFDKNSFKEDIIERDVFNVLKKFDKYGIVSWKNKQNPFVSCQKVGDLKIYKVGLSSLYLLDQTFDYEICDKTFGENIISEKSILSNIIFSNLMHIYILEKNNLPCACAVFNVTETNFVLQMSKLSFNRNFTLNKDYIVLLNYIVSEFKREYYKSDNINLGFFTNVDKKDVMNCCDMGLEEKGKLKYELDNEIYSMWTVQ